MDREFILSTHISPIHNLRVGGTEYEVEVMLNLIKDYDIIKFVEIGVHEGGLTEYLMFYTKVQYLGVEINEQIPRPELKQMVADRNGKFAFLDCQSDACYNIVWDFVQNTKDRVIIYCDDGNKPQELIRYASIPKKNDILLVHDYSDGTRKLDGVDNYIAREVTPEDIEFMNKDKNFSKFPDELFQRTRFAGWIRK